MANGTPVTSATVAVDFKEDHTFHCTPPVVNTLTAAPSGASDYTVIFNLSSSIPNTTFVSGNTVQDPPPDLRWTPSNGGMTLTATFTNTGLTAVDDYGFTLTVDSNGTEYTSQDPEVEIPPPN